MKTSQSINRIGPVASFRAEVERALSAAIISGELAPGVVVSVPTLAAQFEISATPVREAMLDLEKRGFVESVRNKGFRITTVSENDLREIVQVRRWLEVPATVLAADHLADDDLPRFRALADKIVEAASEGRMVDYLAADSEFHLAILRLTGNERVVRMVAELRSQTRMVGLAEMHDTVELEKSAAEHHALLELLAAGKTDEVEALMHRHIGHVAGWWSGHPEEESTVDATA